MSRVGEAAMSPGVRKISEPAGAEFGIEAVLDDGAAVIVGV